jgi:hypothetical protein
MVKSLTTVSEEENTKAGIRTLVKEFVRSKYLKVNDFKRAKYREKNCEMMRAALIDKFGHQSAKA